MANLRIAVVGGTGLVGRHAVRVIAERGHEPVVVARSTGVDVTTGAGLDDALTDVAAVIDVTNTAATDRARTREFFGSATGHLLAAEQRAGVRHHVLLSIVGLERVPGNPHYVGKLHQEELVRSGPIPFTILRATQFHEFPEMVVGWTEQAGRAVLPPLLIAPVAAADVAAELVDLALGEPLGRVTELAGPEQQDFVDMARRALAAHGRTVQLVPSWRDGPFGVEMAGEVLLPDPQVRRGADDVRRLAGPRGRRYLRRRATMTSHPAPRLSAA